MSFLSQIAPKHSRFAKFDNYDVYQVIDKHAKENKNKQHTKIISRNRKDNNKSTVDIVLPAIEL